MHDRKAFKDRTAPGQPVELLIAMAEAEIPDLAYEARRVLEDKSLDRCEAEAIIIDMLKPHTKRSPVVPEH